VYYNLYIFANYLFYIRFIASKFSEIAIFYRIFVFLDFLKVDFIEDKHTLLD